MTNLERAAKHIDATDLGGGEWAHYDEGPQRYYVVSEVELSELADYIDDEDAQVSDAYSHWCAATTARKMPIGWEPGMDLDAVRTYTIFDSDPTSSGGTAWPSHEDVELDEDDVTLEAATAEVEAILATEAAGLNPSDGYEVGQLIYAYIWDRDGTAHLLSYCLTADDLGVDAEVAS